MKTAEQIAQEMEKHKPIDKTNVMFDETWEEYMRGGRMTNGEAIEEIKNYENYPNGLSKECRDYIIKTLEQVPSSVSLDVYKQVAKERDIAIEQLHELGYEFGQIIEPTTKNNLAQERYQDLIEYFGGEDTVLKDRKEFKAWLERVKWHVKRADELAREFGQLKPTAKDCLLVEQIVDEVIEKVMPIKPKDMPSVTPQESRWIPVSERLPDKFNDVLITFFDCPNEYDVAYLRTTFDELYKENGAKNEWVSSMGEITYADYEVVAWKPIELYKSESEK